MDEECDKKDVVPIVEENVDIINLHDLLAQTVVEQLPVDVKQDVEVSSSWSGSGSVDDKNEVMKVFEYNGMDENPGTSEERFFCALCQSIIPAGVPYMVILPEHHPTFKDRVRQVLLRKYSTFMVEEVLCCDEGSAICRRHLEEEQKLNGVNDFYCALCRQGISGTVPNIVVTQDPICREPIRMQLLRKYNKMKVDLTLAVRQPLFICEHHVDVELDECNEEENVSTFCVFCNNEHILRKYTTVIPSTPREQKIFRRCIRDAICFRKRIASVMHLAQQQDADAEPLRMCNEHLKAGSISELVILLKPKELKERKRKGPQRKVKTPEELEAERLRKLAYTRRRRAEIRQDNTLRERERLYQQARWIKLKNDPEKLAQRNRTHRAYHKRHPRPPETAEQKAERSVRDRLRRERMKREREERERQTEKGKRREREASGEQTGKENEEGEERGKQTEHENKREPEERGEQTERRKRKTPKTVEKRPSAVGTAEESNADRMGAERRRERSPSKRTRKMTAKARECSEGMW